MADTRLEPGATGTPRTRIEAHAKVTGGARYPSDTPLANPAYAWLVTSEIARGQIASMDLSAAKALPGVLDILWHGNVGNLIPPEPAIGGRGKPTTTMQDRRVWHFGQIIAIVVAETPEVAREAAGLIVTTYDEKPPAAGFDSAGAHAMPLAEATVNDARTFRDTNAGDADAAFTNPAFAVEAEYETPTQHHNPMELYTTACQWDGQHLTVHESSQFVHGLRANLATQLGMDPEQVRIVSRYIGGAFGGRGEITSRTAWIALAAQRVGRPVKLEATRKQGFTIATYRAETRHRIALAADAQGRLQGLKLESWEATSRPSTYTVAGSDTVARIYAVPNIATKVNVVQLDRNTPGYMRAPPDLPYMFALESAMDELAYAVGVDPVELRIRNDAQRERVENRPYTSRHMIECYRQGAEAFGWNKRTATPGTMRDGDWLVGYGCATTSLHATIEAAFARLALTANGRAVVETAAIDFGNGTYTAIAQVVADRLGIAIDAIEVRIGDSRLPPAGYAAGSKHCASVCNAVAKACEMIRADLAKRAVEAPEGALRGADAAAIEVRGDRLIAGGQSEPLADALGRLGGRIEVLAHNVPAGAGPGADGSGLWRGQSRSVGGTRLPDKIRASFGAQFVEVRVHALTREIRMRRALGVYAAGTIVNPVTARAQMVGGMIWGISAALHESSDVDPLRAAYVNDNLAEYLIPVNADIDAVDVMFLPERDLDLNGLGIKGIGELGITGMNAAVANAVFHATGKRIRKLPCRIDDLI